MDHQAGHTPVLVDEVTGLLCPTRGVLLVDCTVGEGGHTQALLNAAGKDAILIGLDTDETNLTLTRRRLSSFGERVRLFNANFSELPAVLAEAKSPHPDAILADLGVSSTQLDDPRRGFSFSVEGPLDMRMDMRTRRTAQDLINTLGEKELADLIYSYGEERYSRRIARAIVRGRGRERIETTTQLARIVRGAYPPAVRKTRRGVHPATRTFQALRIAVNDELGNLERLLAVLPDVLGPGGRAAVISFHSLEDRRVKRAFAEMAASGVARLLTKKPVTPTAEEVKSNPRARSARLRGIERIT